MKQDILFDAIGEIDERYVRAARQPRMKCAPAWGRWIAAAACVCMVVGMTFFSVNAYGANHNASLLTLETAPPAGLTLTIVDAAPDDAEFLITNDSACAATYGKATRVEQLVDGAWVEIVTESAGIYPATRMTIPPGRMLYGMCAWWTQEIVLEPGVYRYSMVVDVTDGKERYPVVLRAEFAVE